MPIDRILVFGATGTQGHPVVDAALDAGLTVRAATRDPDEAEEKLPGVVEAVYADLLKAGEVDDAMSGCDAVFFHVPMLGDDDDPMAVVDNVMNAALKHSVDRVVFTTGGFCGDIMPPVPMVEFMRATSERVLGFGAPAVVLRPTLYLANLVWPHLIRQIREYGQLTYPPFDTHRRLNWTSTDDQGQIVVACLEADVAGETIDIASPEAVTGPEMCRLLAGVYGREVHYAPQDLDEFTNTLAHLTGSAKTANLLGGYYAAINDLERDGPLVDTDAVEQRLDIRLTPVGEWVENRLGRLIELYG